MYLDRDQWGVFAGKVKLASSCQRAVPMALLNDIIHNREICAFGEAKPVPKNYKDLRQ
ncbi:unnamed protein product [marine sediment metagenome]|uniref:Uncharacterized protein n=1 Tax=marine sediment metagenome TaxID=412755 RepID=X0TQP0_9ZZZZ